MPPFSQSFAPPKPPLTPNQKSTKIYRKPQNSHENSLVYKFELITPAKNYQIKTLNISRRFRPEDSIENVPFESLRISSKNVLLMLENLIKRTKAEVSDFFRAVRR